MHKIINIGDTIKTKQPISEHIETEVKTTEQQISAQEAFDATQAAAQQRAKHNKKHKRAETDSLLSDSTNANVPLQFKAKATDTISASQKVNNLKNLFSNDSLSGTNMQSYKIGVAGDPVPYSLASDDLITGLLIGCFILVVLSISQSKKFIQKQLKSLFSWHAKGDSSIHETSRELGFQFLMCIQTCLLLSLIYFFYTTTYIAQTFSLEQYQLIGIYAGVVLLYFAFKAIIYQITNSVFFDKQEVVIWNKALLFSISIEGLILYPVVLLRSYFSMSIHSTFIYTIGVIVFFKLLTLYNSYNIFFRKRPLSLQIILYFCTHEIVPFAILWGILQMITNYQKINF